MFKRRKWTLAPSWQGTAAGDAFGSLEKVFALSGTPVASDKQSSVCRTEVAGRYFYVKRYHRATGLRSWVGRARIRLEARNLLWFSLIGLPAAEVVAYGEEHVLGRTLRGCLVTAEQVETNDLAWVARHKPELCKNPQWVDAVVRQLAEITRALHARGFCHNDLKWRNILVTRDALLPRLYLIDCPTGQRWPGFLLRRRVVKDLACLDKMAKYHLSRAQRMRFFKLYRHTERLSTFDKQTIRAVLAYFDGRE